MLPRRTIPRTETVDNTSPRIRTRELEVRVDRPQTSAAGEGCPQNWKRVDRGRRLLVDSVRRLRPERSNMKWVNRGPRPRVKGRGSSLSVANSETTFPFGFPGQTRVFRVDPVRVLSYYKYILDLILYGISFSLKNILCLIL